MKYIMRAFVVCVALLSAAYAFLYEKDTPGEKCLRPEDLPFIHFSTNESSSKASLSFCLRDESVSLVTAQIDRSDSGNIHIGLWRGDEAYNELGPNTSTLIHKSALPGLTQSLEKDGKVVKGEAISGFNIILELNPSAPAPHIVIGGEKISLKDRGGVIKRSGAPKCITSWPHSF